MEHPRREKILRKMAPARGRPWPAWKMKKMKDGVRYSWRAVTPSPHNTSVQMELSAMANLKELRSMELRLMECVPQNPRMVIALPIPHRHRLRQMVKQMEALLLIPNPLSQPPTAMGQQRNTKKSIWKKPG